MTTRITNDEFGRAVKCDFTMASRLRNGERLPSRELMERIVAAYGLDANEALSASRKGGKAFSAYLRKNVFERKPEKTDVAETREPEREPTNT